MNLVLCFQVEKSFPVVSASLIYLLLTVWMVLEVEIVFVLIFLCIELNIDN